MSLPAVFQRWGRPAFAFLLAFVSCFGAALAASTQREDASPIQMAGRARVVNVSAALDSHDKQWLAGKGTLVVGILPNDLVPFDIVGLSNEYEGVSADYLDAVSAILGVELKIRTFKSAEDARRALVLGDVDLLSSMHADMSADSAIAYSAAYFPLRHVEVDAPGKVFERTDEINVGYVPGHVSVDALRRAFPHARFAAYGNVFLGLTAVAGRKIDVFVDDGISIAYVIDQYPLLALRPENFGEATDSWLHFATRREDTTLLRLVNKALASIPLRTRMDIKTRWSSSYEPSQSTGRVNLSERERQWVRENPVVRYATMQDRMPFMFIDRSGHFNGLSVQVMDLIANRTGLSFEPGAPWTDTPSRASTQKNDLMPVLARGTVPDPNSNFTESDGYFEGYWVVIFRQDEPDFLRLEDLKGKRIVYVNSAPYGVIKSIKERVPSVQLIPVGTFAESYDYVASKKADLTVGNISTASYFIRQNYAGRLKIAGAINEGAPVDIAFGVRPDAPELLSIINKALQSISPDEMRRMRENWMFLSHPVTDWRRYTQVFYGVGISLFAFFVLLAMWNRSLQKQIRRRQQAEAQLHDQLAFRYAMLEGIPHAIVVRDKNTRLIFCNSAYERFFGISRQIIEGKTLLEFETQNEKEGYISLDIRQHLQTCYEQVLAEGKLLSEDMDVRLSGVARKILHWAAPISLKEGGERVALIAGTIDVTERYQLLELIESARAKAEAANRAKSNFLATMSHEIRTPMNAVMGMLELLVREGRLNPEDRESAELARDSASSLLSLIDDILDISKIESGGLEIVSRPAQLSPVVHEVGQIFESLARQRGLFIHVEIDPALAAWHAIDSARFRQIVNNLVSNAIKYTDTGGVWVRLRHINTIDEVEMVQLEVEDSGIGIAPEDIKNLFNPFFQAEAAGPRAIGGTGLGLPIVHRLCMKMGGEISVESQTGKGTCVRITFRLVTLPAPEETAVLPSQASETTPERRRERERFHILVVDDHPANRLLLLRQLGFLGFRGTSSENGETAFALWREGGYDLVITDCSMPVMDGYEFTAAIRAYEREHKLPRCPVLGSTAHVQEEDRRHALDVGMDECLMKPVGVDTLLQALQRHLGDTDGAAALLPSTAAEANDTAPPASVPGAPFDVSSLKSFSGGDGKVESSFLDALMQTNSADIAELRVSASTGALREIAAGAHKIKGAARIVKARDVVAACEEVEHAVKQDDADALAQRIAALTSQVQRLNEAIAEQLKTYAPRG